ncbi:MAG: hypothetical protein IPM54_26395 [Polyangiaceae bacterium]|nr:hypothetical protein [Polyangiaceae bacterium]
MSERILFAVLTGVFSSGLVFAFSTGCERHANIRDENDDTLLDKPPELEAGPIPVVDSGVESDAYLACLDRPLGDCVGSNDFLCGFEKWMRATAENCQMTTGCKTNGWLEVTMAGDGCVSEIRMDKPNDEMVACLVAEFGAVRCPCAEIEGSYYFGNTNSGACASP